ncbi:ATP-binding protein [Nocardiopsis sp. LOL_012]|uniref:ATP-binding protein n=1 Tax=Nocardiopsis sp. LOL_012 TaxID=3345409 RepID=UPI003A888A00
MPATAPTSTPPPVPVLGEATVPLSSFIQPACRHYFSSRPERPNYRMRRYTFAGTPAVMPLVRAFLDTCAAERDRDYRYLFTLLGSEPANNALDHSLSGRPGGSYTLLAHRHRTGLHLTCDDRGGLHRRDSHLKASADSPNPEPGSGRGLALVDALSTDWGDNGPADFRRVWFYLAYDPTGSRWNAPADA